MWWTFLHRTVRSFIVCGSFSLPNWRGGVCLKLVWPDSSCSCSTEVLNLVSAMLLLLIALMAKPIKVKAQMVADQVIQGKRQLRFFSHFSIVAGGMAMSLHQFGPDWKVATTIQWIAMKFSKFEVKCLNNFWFYCHQIRFMHSSLPQGEF